MSISVPRYTPFVLLAAAVVCYAVGLAAGAAVLIALGAVCEAAFWYRLIRRRR